MTSRSYVGRHRRGRHRLVVDHVTAGRPCLKTVWGLVGFVVLMAALGLQFEAVTVVPEDPPQAVPVAYVAPVDTTQPGVCR